MIVAYAGALLLTVSSHLPVFPALALSLALIVHGVTSIRQYARLATRRSVTALALGDDRIEIFRVGDKNWRPCSLASCFVSRHLVVLRIKSEEDKRKFNIPLLSDACKPDEFRLLRKYLRLNPLVSTQQNSKVALWASKRMDKKV